ncbi:MAG: LLM class flavin-dependent oxidoreductase [Actinomycetota bacterium]
MDIGIGLPNPVPGTPGRLLVDWAQRAEERGFSSVATIDRIVYPSYDSLLVLAAAAAVTKRITLMTNILIAPTRNTALLAKEAASVDQLSGGRLVLGLGVGGRENDFVATGQSFHERGRRFDQQLELMHRAWRGDPISDGEKSIGPRPSNGTNVPVLIGGYNLEAGIPRILEYGTGFTIGGAGADHIPPLAGAVREAWSDAGKPGAPKIVALAYYALGGRDDAGRDYLLDYYAIVGDLKEMIAGAMISGPDAVLGALKAFTDAGVDELVMVPTVAELDQIDLLADVALN